MAWSFVELVSFSYTIFVGDMAIRYDPPRRGRVIPMVVHLNEAQEHINNGGSYIDLVEGPKPEGGLRPMGINRHVYRLVL